MNKLLLFLVLMVFTSCAELQQIADQLPQQGGYDISNAEIALGLKQALNKGIETEVSKLAEEDGFFNNEMVRIGLPPELQKVDRALRDIGLDALADEGLHVLNRAAEEAVKGATPIFVDAVQDMTFADARDILFGSDTAATAYLEEATTDALYTQFRPEIRNSLDQVGATEIWASLIGRYNSLPLTNDVNPSLPDYVTGKALEGVFTMIAVEEMDIRNDLSARTTALLRKIFSLQD